MMSKLNYAFSVDELNINFASNEYDEKSSQVLNDTFSNGGLNTSR